MVSSRQRSLSCVLVLMGLVSACGGPADTPVNNTGPRGRALSVPRFLERIDRNRLRVVAFAFGGVSVGQCADASGALRPGQCIQGAGLSADSGESLSKLTAEVKQHAALKEAEKTGEIEKWVHGRYGVRPTAKEIESLLQASDAERQGVSKQVVDNAVVRALSLSSGELKELAPDRLNTGVFSQYTRTLDIDLTGSLAAGASEAKTTNAYKRYEIIYEWRRYALIKVPGAPNYTASGPHVTSLEGGFAVRMVISVTTVDTKQEGKGSGAVGLADLEMALALGHSEVYVGYELTGANHEMLPDAPLTIRNTQQLWEAFEKFHAAMRRLEATWACAVKKDGKDANGCCTQGGAASGAAVCPMGNQFDVLAYYVQGTQVGDIYAEFESGREGCYNTALARSRAKSKKERAAAQSELKTCLTNVTSTYEASIGGHACYRQALAQVEGAKNDEQRVAAQSQLWKCVETEIQAQRGPTVSQAGRQSRQPGAGKSRPPGGD